MRFYLWRVNFLRDLLGIPRLERQAIPVDDDLGGLLNIFVANDGLDLVVRVVDY